MAGRRAEEFYCDKSGGGCGGYFLTWLRESMFGNYTIVCPKCGHHHFRVIEIGLVTNDRHQERMGTTTVIPGLLSTFKDTPWHDDPDFRRKQMKAYEGGLMSAP